MESPTDNRRGGAIMQSETTLPMSNSLASLLISEKERYKKIQKLKEEKDCLIKKIQYSFSPEGRKQMLQQRLKELEDLKAYVCLMFRYEMKEMDSKIKLLEELLKEVEQK